VINEEIKVSRVKKRLILQTLKRMGFKTHSELNEILPEKKRPSVIAQEDDKPEGGDDAPEQEEEKVAPGEVGSNEYDYLLTMQIMSLTEERVLDLQKLMKDKKSDHDRLEAMHIYDLWENDLKLFLQELDKYEAQEEKDRLAHKANRDGNKGKRKPGHKAPAAKPGTGAPAAPKKKPGLGNSDEKKVVKKAPA
jgi:hypothetical protein